ncbi:MAG: hypothetical protein SGI96_21145 [Bacteroidota bacterium]|nr:hypothetical protein [Bacteroidota bacterium]
MKILIAYTVPINRFPVIGYLFSWAIRKFDKSQASHTCVIWYSNTAEEYIVYQAAEFSLHFVGYELFRQKNKMVRLFETEVTDNAYRAVMKYCLRKAGTRYGLKSVIGVGLKKIFKLKNNPFADGEKTQFCSETVGYIIKDVIGFRIDQDFEAIGVRQTLDIMIEYKEFREVQPWL